MSLLSALLNHMPPTIASNNKTNLASRDPERPRLMLANRIERPALLYSSPHASAATATTEWRRARDQYLNHIMACRGCYAPTGRHCTTGAHLRASYDNTPMEARP
ncbi:hypothetical protein SAMN03159453_02601 [Pseudomonas sp. NFIX28]|nr:hypothetical protein [Pseudomonas sp. NFIX28]SDZ15505.1 hypothetical protein SAMN03159453_02601 [Pseudomonas sp. NFIX28]